MKKVKSGKKIVVTDRKKEITIIAPIETKSGSASIRRLIATGAAAWSGGKPEGLADRVVAKGETVSAAVVEDRR